jgi:hypothetical protein
MLEIKGQRPNQLTWKDRNPSNYSFTKIDVAQFLPNKSSTKKIANRNNGKKRVTQ